MLDFSEFSSTIGQLTHSQRFTEALRFFKENKHTMNKVEIENKDSLMADIIRCLSESKYYRAVLIFAEEFRIKIEPQTSPEILKNFGWNLYFAYNDFIKHRPSTTGYCKIEERVLHTRLVQYCKATKDISDVDIRRVIDVSINVMLKYEIKKMRPNYDFLIDFCKEINPESLDTQSFEATVTIKGKTKTVELQSARENYFNIYTKALLAEEKADLCIEKIQEALKGGFKFHFYSDVWLNYRMAQAEVLRWNFDKSIEIINEKVLPKKQDWFVYQTLAQCYNNKDDHRQALIYAKKALEQRGDLKYKTDLIYLITNIYLAMKEREKELKVIELGRRIRAEQGWKENIYYELKRDELPKTITLSIGELYRMVLKDMEDV